MIQLFIDLWELVAGPIMPDYILKAFNWFSFAFILLMVFLPIIVLFTVMWLAKGVGKYE